MQGMQLQRAHKGDVELFIFRRSVNIMRQQWSAAQLSKGIRIEQPGRYELIESVLFPEALSVGIDIAVSNVVVDLQHHRLSYQRPGLATCLLSIQPMCTDVSVRNGFFSACGTALRVERDCADIEICNLHVFDFLHQALEINTARNIRVKNCILGPRNPNLLTPSTVAAIAILPRGGWPAMWQLRAARRRALGKRRRRLPRRLLESEESRGQGIVLERVRIFGLTGIAADDGVLPLGDHPQRSGAGGRDAAHDCACSVAPMGFQFKAAPVILTEAQQAAQAEQDAEDEFEYVGHITDTGFRQNMRYCFREVHGELQSSPNLSLAAKVRTIGDLPRKSVVRSPPIEERGGVIYGIAVDGWDDVLWTERDLDLEVEEAGRKTSRGVSTAGRRRWRVVPVYAPELPLLYQQSDGEEEKGSDSDTGHCARKPRDKVDTTPPPYIDELTKVPLSIVYVSLRAHVNPVGNSWPATGGTYTTCNCDAMTYQVPTGFCRSRRDTERAERSRRHSY